MQHQFEIDPDTRKANTLPASFYQSVEVFEDLKSRVFSNSWQWIGDDSIIGQSSNTHPFNFMEGFITEPMMLTTDNAGNKHCLSNVCTHRANIILDHPAQLKKLLCGYHGRRFALDGQFEFMPEFSDAIDFPRACDNLHKFPLEEWQGLLFTSIEPSFNFESIVKILDERTSFLNLKDFKRESKLSKEYLVHAHWALYCDNYLEGFHIPFVHSDLNAVLDYSSYETILYDNCVLQIGYGNEAEETFKLPENHVDHGKMVSAYYYWIFPNLMLNFYPWGLSLNVVRPLDINRTKVSFISYVDDETKLNQGAGAILDKVEREDEFVVENVYKGLKSSVYQSGRFSPVREQGVHHFHGLLADAISS